MKNTISVHVSLNKTPGNDNPEFIHQVHVIENGWRMIGYHAYINKQGDIFTHDNHPLMRPIEMDSAAVKHHNRWMISICLGGIDESDLTEAQFRSLRRLVRSYMFDYNIHQSEVKGHNEYSGHETRGCPNFNVQRKIFFNNFV